jgi:hypothetical protein
MRNQRRLAFSIFNLLVLLLLGVAGVQSAFADSNPAQPIYGFTWPTHSLPVAIDAPQPNARNAVLKAMNTWNLAQQWFITAYMNGAGTPFVLYETKSTSDSMITVTFNQTQTREELGWTNAHEFHDQQGVFRKVVVDISIDLTRQSGESLTDTELQTLATHELGHALGLDHTTFSTSDLMYHIPKVIFPSTLNLYATYLLSKSTSVNNLPQEPVTLPQSIPYMMVSQAELNSVTPPAVQTATTSSLQLTQLISTLAYGPWPYVGFFVVLAAVVVALAVRGRRRTVTETDLEEAEVIFHENPAAESQLNFPDRVKKKCNYCGAEVRPEDSICRKCGMPAMYRK